ERAQHARRIAGDDRVRRNASGDDAAGTDERALADFDAAQDGGARSDRCRLADDGGRHGPVRIGLQLALGVDRAGIAIVDEHHSVADEDVVLDFDAFADERMALHFDPPADLRAALNLDERADPAFIADFAAVEIDELEDLDVAAQPHVVGDRLKLHSLTRLPSWRNDSSAACSNATTRTPAAAPVSGARRSAIDAANSSITRDSASRRSSFGAYMSPVRYDTKICRRVSSSRTSKSTPLS